MDIYKYQKSGLLYTMSLFSYLVFLCKHPPFTQVFYSSTKSTMMAKSEENWKISVAGLKSRVRFPSWRAIKVKSAVPPLFTPPLIDMVKHSRVRKPGKSYGQKVLREFTPSYRLWSIGAREGRSNTSRDRIKPDRGRRNEKINIGAEAKTRKLTLW